MDRRLPVIGWVGLLSLGCADLSGFDGNPQMNPGADCLTCHAPGGSAAALSFAVAGTVFPLATASLDGGGVFDAEIDLGDATGRSLVLHSNGAGNFYTAEPLTAPFSVTVKVGGASFPMQNEAPSGACNSCHAVAFSADAGALVPVAVALQRSGFGLPPGRVYAFGADGGCGAPAAASQTPSYQWQVQAIVEGSCFPCHSASGIAPPTLESPADLVAGGTTTCAGLIAACKMPPSGAAPMSPEEQALLLAWLAAGAPSN